MRIVLLFFAFQIWAMGSALASDKVFVDTSEGIIDQLTNQDGLGATRSFIAPEQKTRTITVRLKDDGRRHDKSVQIVDNDSLGVARLKVEFDVNSSHLRTESYEILDNLGVALADVRISGRQVCIKGHTDSDGGNRYNLGLSYDRAEAVREYVVVRHGLSSADLFVVGYGEQIPLAANSTPANKQMNRRVELTLGCPEVQ